MIQQHVKDFSGRPGNDLAGDINMHLRQWEQANTGQMILIDRIYTFDRVIENQTLTWLIVVFTTQPQPRTQTK